MTETAFCRTCGAQTLKETKICPKCGIRQKPNQVKNPGLAAIASFFWVGLGQIYNGEIGKGILFMVVQIINALLIAVVIGLITFPVFWLYGIYDAYKTAEKINNNAI